MLFTQIHVSLTHDDMSFESLTDDLTPGIWTVSRHWLRGVGPGWNISVINR